MEHFHTTSLLGIGLEDYDSGMISAGALMQYLYDTQKSTMPHITNIQPYTTGCYMIVDTSPVCAPEPSGGYIPAPHNR